MAALRPGTIGGRCLRLSLAAARPWGCHRDGDPAALRLGIARHALAAAGHRPSQGAVPARPGWGGAGSALLALPRPCRSRPGPGPSVPGWRSAAAPRPRAARARRTWPRTRSRPAADTRLPACSCACLLVRAPACLLMHPACPRARPASPTANKGLCVLAGCSDPTRPAVGVTPHEWVTAPVDAHGGPDSGDSFYKEQIEVCGPSSQQ